MAQIPCIPQRLGVVCAVVLPLLRFLFLHHLAADLSSSGSRLEPTAERATGRHADALRGLRKPVLRMAGATPAGVDRQRRADPPPSRLCRLWWSFGHAVVVHVDPRSLLGDVRDESFDLRSRAQRTDL